MSGLHQLYLERLLARAKVGDPTWSSGPAVSIAVLERMLNYKKRGEDYMLPVDNEALFHSLEYRGVPDYELEALLKVPVPQQRAPRTPVVDDAALMDLLDLTGKSYVQRGPDRTPEHNAELRCWLKAFQVLKQKYPRVWQIFQQGCRKLCVSTSPRGSEDASWESPMLVLNLKGKGSPPKASLCLYFLVHEIGHIYEDSFNLSDLFDVYGPHHPPCVTSYAERNVSEDFAETFAYYWRQPSMLKRTTPAKYADMEARLSGKLRAAAHRKATGDGVAEAAAYLNAYKDFQGTQAFIREVVLTPQYDKIKHIVQLWRSWTTFYRAGKDWAKFVLDHKTVPKGGAKAFEMAVRLFGKTYGRGHPPDILTWYDQNTKRFDLLEAAVKWPARAEGGGTFQFGPFTVHDTINASTKDLALAEDIIAKAVQGLRSVPLAGLAQMAYGDLFLVGQIGRKNWAAWYMVSKDAIYLRPNIRGVTLASAAGTLVHEIGHRYWAKKFSAETKKAWNQHHYNMENTHKRMQWPEVGDVLPLKVNNKTVKLDSWDFSDSYATLVDVKTGESIGRVGRYQMIKWMQNVAHKSAFPTLYASTDAEEHFCESLSLYAQGKLDGDNKTAFERIVLGVGVPSAARVAARATVVARDAP